MTMTAGGQAAPLDHAAIRSILWGIMLAMLLAALDQTIVATALPSIGQDLGDIEHLPWVVTTYLLTSTAVTPLYGKVADIHGRRIAMMIGVGIFILGSVLCAAAPNMMVLVLARALQGIGGGGLISLGQTILADVVAPRERGRYQAYFAAVFVTSSVAGPVLGGYFAEHLHWSMIFWINLPLGLLAFLMTNHFLKRLPRYERPHKLDLLGALLMIGSTVALLLALSWGGLRYPWLSWPILALVLASVALGALFVVRLMTAVEPLLPLAVIGNPIVAWGTVVACLTMGSFIGLAVYLPIYLQTVVGMSISGSGLGILGLSVGTVSGATFSGRVMVNVVHYRRLPLAGLAIAAIAQLVLAFRADLLPFWQFELLLVLTGVGVGTVLPVSTVAIQNAVAMHQMGTATAVMNFFRSLGGAIVVAVFGAVLLGIAGTGHEIGPEMRPAFAQAFGWIFLLTAIGIAAALLALLCMEERPLRGSNPEAAPVASD